MILGGCCYADTLSPRIGLTLPTTGQADSWGAKLNRNFEVIDSSVAIPSAATTVTAPWVFTSSVAFSTFSVAQVRIGSTSYSGSEKLIVDGTTKLMGPAGILQLCDLNGENCTQLYGGSGVSTISLDQDSWLWINGGGSNWINYQLSCDPDSYCYRYQDTLSKTGGAGSATHTMWNPSISNSFAGTADLFGFLFSPEFFGSPGGVSHHAIYVANRSSSPVGGINYSIHVVPINISTGTTSDYGISVDMSEVKNENATKISGKFSDGEFIVEGSTRNAYSVVVSTYGSTAYHLSVSTSGATIFGGPFRPQSKMKAQIQAIASPRPIAGDSYYCSNCVRDSVCTSTGGINSFVAVSSRTQACN